MADPPRKRQSLSEISGPDRRYDRQPDSVEHLNELIREQHAAKHEARRELREQAVAADKRLAEVIAANDRLVEALAEHVRAKASVVPAPVAVAVKTTPHWLTLVLALVAALGGGGAGAGITKAISSDKAEDVAPEMQKLRDRIYLGERGDAKRQEYLRERQDPEELRWRLVLSWICRVNASKAFARGINCNDGIDFTTPTMKPKYFRTEETWPRLPSAP